MNRRRMQMALIGLMTGMREREAEDRAAAASQEQLSYDRNRQERQDTSDEAYRQAQMRELDAQAQERLKPQAGEEPKLQEIFEPKTGRRTKGFFSGGQWVPVGGTEAAPTLTPGQQKLNDLRIKSEETKLGLYALQQEKLNKGGLSPVQQMQLENLKLEQQQLRLKLKQAEREAAGDPELEAYTKEHGGIVSQGKPFFAPGVGVQKKEPETSPFVTQEQWGELGKHGYVPDPTTGKPMRSFAPSAGKPETMPLVLTDAENKALEDVVKAVLPGDAARIEVMSKLKTAVVGAPKETTEEVRQYLNYLLGLKASYSGDKSIVNTEGEWFTRKSKETPVVPEETLDLAISALRRILGMPGGGSDADLEFVPGQGVVPAGSVR